MLVRSNRRSARCELLASLPTKPWSVLPSVSSGLPLKITVFATAVNASGWGTTVVLVGAVFVVVVEVVVVVIGHTPVRGRQKSFTRSTSRRGRVGDTASVLMRRPGRRRAFSTGVSTPTNAPHAELANEGKESPAWPSPRSDARRRAEGGNGAVQFGR